MEEESHMVTSNTPPTNPNDAPDVTKTSGDNFVSGSVVRAESEAGGSHVVVVKRKRGRPRKDVGDTNLLSPMSMSSPPPGGSTEKRSRGRPRGSGKLQILASIGGFVAETAGGCFKPHVVTVNVGEDVVSRILSFLHKSNEVVCILSAAGAVSSVFMRHQSSSSQVLKYEGCFEIVSLCGSCTFASGIDGARHKNAMLSVILGKGDGSVFGGCIESSMIAATPIQLSMATFKQNIISKKVKRKLSIESPNEPCNQDSLEAQQNVPKLIEGEQSLASPTSGPTPATPPNGATDNAIPATTNGESNTCIDHEDLDMNSENQTMDPITLQSKVADVDVNVPLI
ncbi:hypothetical protein TanjilG_29307 [Lupinus angustifolius]|uniref:AT-hook motif nuclear-localized protein n=1 Tax=Lupinus angustifolius TaxID=3871 RepID=A0A1J7HL47_LUPAN|nr:PREDICTED: AT-hook motif nuclear-localized protein 9-like [Lupinus angustifolius]OIW13566.1 hypothetical protein TanjilG_29307 [Lupinus angustifolius]